MRLLTVPNWSFGRNKPLLHEFQTVLESSGADVHYCQSDIDHNRTVVAFSAEPEVLLDTLLKLCELAFDAIDLNRHVGVHPRIGALDVCPIVPYENTPADFLTANAVAERLGAMVGGRYGVPVYLYERSERGRHESDLPSLRRGGFGGLLEKTLSPDFGPSKAHPELGVSVVGVRDFLLAVNADLKTEDLGVAKALAKQIRTLRREGDERFLGVRALGFPLASRELTQVSLNLTLPDLTAVDPIMEWILEEAAEKRVRIAGYELIGVIRAKDCAGATTLPIKDRQVVLID